MCLSVKALLYGLGYNQGPFLTYPNARQHSLTTVLTGEKQCYKFPLPSYSTSFTLFGQMWTNFACRCVHFTWPRISHHTRMRYQILGQKDCNFARSNNFINIKININLKSIKYFVMKNNITFILSAYNSLVTSMKVAFWLDLEFMWRNWEKSQQFSLIEESTRLPSISSCDYLSWKCFT